MNRHRAYTLTQFRGYMHGDIIEEREVNGFCRSSRLQQTK